MIKSEIFDGYDEIEIENSFEQQKRVLAKKQKDWETDKLRDCEIIFFNFRFL